MERTKTGLLLAGVLCLALTFQTAFAQETSWESYYDAGLKAFRQGRYDEAEKQLEAALKEAKKFGKQDPRLATSLNNLAALYKAQGKYAQAEPLYKRSLAMREKALGPEHPDVAQSLENYADLLRKMDRGAKAKKMEARAHARWLKRAIKLYQGGSKLYHEGKVDKAIAEFRKALRLEPDDAYWHLGLGLALDKKGDRHSALDQYRIAIQLVPDDPGLRSTYEKLHHELEKGEAVGIESAKHEETPPQTVPHRTSGESAWAAPARAGRRIFSEGDDVSAPIPIHKPEPPYSKKARKAHYQGTTVLLIVVDKQGKVSDIRVLKPLGAGLDANAIKTVRTWKFHPALRNGVPVAVRVSLEITFRLF